MIWAMGIIGGFYVLTLFRGWARQSTWARRRSSPLTRAAHGRRCLPSTSARCGFDVGNLFLAFVAAVAFATIVRVVAGLVLAAASAMAHDLWVGVIRGEQT